MPILGTPRARAQDAFFIAEGGSYYEPEEAGTQSAQFLISLSRPQALPVSVTYKLVGESATVGSDFAPTALEGVVEFAAGETRKLVTVPLLPDTEIEPVERFTITLTTPSVGTIEVSTATATILDAGDHLSLRSEVVTVTERNSGAQPATVNLSLSHAASEPISIQYATRDQSATEGADYQRTSGNLDFATGETSKTIAVPVNGDTTPESDERFNVELTSLDAVDIAAGWDEAAALIPESAERLGLFGDAVVISGDTLAIGYPGDGSDIAPDGQVWIYRRIETEWRRSQVLRPADDDEGKRFGNALAFDDSGETLFVGVHQAVQVFSKANDAWNLTQIIPAVAPADRSLFGESLACENGRLVIGAPSYIIDDLFQGAVFLYSQGEDRQWKQDATLLEPSGSSGNFGLYVATNGEIVAASSHQGVTDIFSRHQGGANQWGFQRRIENSGPIDLDADMLAIATGTRVELHQQHSGGINAWGTTAIIRPSGLPQQFLPGDSVAPVVLQGDLLVVGTTQHRFEETNLPPPGSIHVFRRDHSAAPFVEKHHVTFSASTGVDRLGYRSWPIATDGKTIVAGFPEAPGVPTPEFPFIQHAGAAYAIEGNRAVVQIQDDEERPYFGFKEADLVRWEGEPTVYLEIALEQYDGSFPLVLEYETRRGTAVGGQDYAEVFGQIEIPAGTNQVVAAIEIALLDDQIAEPVETFQVMITSSSRGTILAGRAVATITVQDDDGYRVTARDVTVSEADGEAVVTVTRSGPQIAAGTLGFTTVDGQALAGEDFTQVSGVLSLTAEQPTGTIRVPIIQDHFIEGEETFFILLSDPNLDGIQLPDDPIKVTIGTDSAQTLVNAQTIARTLVPGQELAEDWTQTAFDHALWTIGRNGVGYETDQAGDYKPLIKLDVREQMFSKQSSIYIRLPFEATSPMSYAGLVLKMKYDDGFVAWINGKEVARSLAPASVNWQSAAMGNHADEDALVFEDFDVSSAIPLLIEGRNTLAIQGLNAGATSSDFLVVAELQLAFPAPYQAWLETIPGIDSRQAYPTQDPDGDGLNNFLEFALSLQPTRADADVLRVSPPTEEGGGTIQLSLPDGEPAGIVFELQVTDDLSTGNWTALITSDSADWTPVPLGDGRSLLSVEIPAAGIGDRQELFVRLAAHFRDLPFSR